MPTIQYLFSNGVVHKPTDANHPDEKSESWQLCRHLAPVLEALVKNGFKIEAINDAWAKIDFIVCLTAGPDQKELKRICELPEDLSVFQNKDAHYPLTYDISCDSCKQGISWPY